LTRQQHPAPAWVVVSAGTGGTSSTIGRYRRYSQRAPAATRLCVVDPENSVCFDSYRTGDRSLRIDASSRIDPGERYLTTYYDSDWIA
jgi:cysteine synthase